jgi:hypothetical protein
MIRKSTYRFSAKIMRHHSMIRKSGYRFSEKIMLHHSMIRKSGYRFSEKDHALLKKHGPEEPRAPGSLERESRGPFAHRESVGLDS